MKNRIQQIGEAIVTRQLHSESRDTSFVMFPLRIETRFKKHRPFKTKEQHRVAGVFSQLNHILNDAILHSLLCPHETAFNELGDIPSLVYIKYKTITNRKHIAKQFYRLAMLIGYLDGIYYEDKALIIQLTRHIHTIASVFPAEWQPSLNSICDDICKYAESIPTVKSIKADRATILLRKFEKMVRRIEVLTHYSTTPYRGKHVLNPKKGNRNMMNHITKHLEESLSFVYSIMEELEKVPSMKANQRAKYNNCIHRIVGVRDALLDDFNTNMDNLNFGLGKIEWQEQGKELLSSYHYTVRKIVDELSSISLQLREQIRIKPLNRVRYTHLIHLILKMKLDHLLAIKDGKRYYYRYKTLKRMKENVFFDYQKGKNLSVLMLQQFNVLLAYNDIEFDAKNWLSLTKQLFDKNANGRRHPVDTTLLEQYQKPHNTTITAKRDSLCVRIYPDEVGINKFVSLLTKQEADDGKRFWLRYTLALGDSIREREAWDGLCEMYPAYRAGWIVRQTRPVKELKECAPFNTLRRIYHLLKVPKKGFPKVAIITPELPRKIKALTCLVDYHCDKLIGLIGKADFSHDFFDSSTDPFRTKEAFIKHLNSIRCSATEVVNRLLFGNDKLLLNRLAAWLDGRSSQEQSESTQLAELKLICNDILKAPSSMSGLHGEMITLLRKIDLPYSWIKDAITHLNKDGKDLVFPYFDNYRQPNDFGKPTSPTLPDRFLFEGTIRYSKNKSKTITFYGRRTFPELQIGLNLNENSDIDPFQVNLESGRLTVNSGIKWMTNYYEAEKMGMAITIPLDDIGKDWQSFESIYITGIKDCSETESKKIINDLFHAHFYSEEGLNLLNIGTPTNTLTDSDSTAYDTSKVTLAETHYRNDVKRDYLKYCNIDDKTSDAYRFAAALNMDPSHETNPLLRVSNGSNHEIQRALTVNRKLISHFISNDKLHQYDRKVKGFVERVCSFVGDDVSARGLFPPIRIGSQPYGILPITDFRHYQLKGDQLYKVSQLLLWLTEKWNAISNRSVIHEGNLSNENSVKNYLEMIGCTPTSSSFYSRKELCERSLLNPVFFRGNKNLSHAMADLERFFFALLGIRDETNKKPGEALLNLLSSFDRLPISDTKFTSEIDFHWDELKSLIKDLNVDDREMELLITEFYDLFTYRLDAWMLGLLNYAIRQRVRKQKHQVRIGAFGWVFNLKPDKQEAKSYEYILAPSINHAVTGAVLRSSYNRAREGREEDYRLNVNLSSVRVREALRLIRGLQNGLSVGAVLGADLERFLHECHRTDEIEMDALIFFLRQKYPLVADVYLANGSGATVPEDKKTSHTTIINGESLLHDLRNNYLAGNDKKQLYDLFWEKESSVKFKAWLHEVFGEDFVNKYDKKIKLLVKQLQRIEDTFDALSDVILTESVYKLCEGNRMAVDALMSCVQQGRNIPLPDVVEIPMHSAHVEQRVMVALNSAAVPSPNTKSTMQIADPAIDEWLDSMLGGLKRIGVGFKSDDITDIVSLDSQLNLSASELVYLSGNGDSFFRFLEWIYLTSLSTLPQEAPQTEIDAACTIGDEDTISLAEAQLAIESLRESLVDSRALKADDLIKENLSSDSSDYDIVEIKARFGAVHKKLQQLDTLMSQWEELSDNSILSDEVLLQGIRLLLDCYRFSEVQALDGIEFDIFKRGRTREEDPEGILKAEALQKTFIPHFKKIHRLMQDRLTAVKESPLKNVNDYLKGMQKLLSNTFRMVPKIRVDNNLIDVEGFQKQLHTQFNFKNISAPDLEGWMIEAAKVRKPVHLLQHARMFQQWHDLDEVSLAVMQTPFDNESREWIGATLSSEDLIGDKRSYVLLNKEQLFVPNSEGFRPMAGLVLDYWVERIPYKTQTAGLAFSYDQPDAEAPHAILLAMSPNISSSASRRLSKNWSLADFERSIKSAMHLVKSRAVEPDHIYEDNFMSSFLPLLPYPTDKYNNEH